MAKKSEKVARTTKNTASMTEDTGKLAVELTPEEQAQVDAFVAMNENRATMYELLARLFAKEVDQPVLTSMHDTLYPVHTGNDNVDEGNKLIATYLSNIWKNSLTELRIDYTRTFIGGGNNSLAAAYPSESVYTSEKRLVMQDARDEVLAIYRSVGFDKSEEWKETEDHISVELEFMARMIHRASNAMKKGDEEHVEASLLIQKNFIDDHVLAWVPLFAADMRKFSKTMFYQGLSYLLEGFLESDLAFLSEALEPEADAPEPAVEA